MMCALRVLCLLLPLLAAGCRLVPLEQAIYEGAREYHRLHDFPADVEADAPGYWAYREERKERKERYGEGSVPEK